MINNCGKATHMGTVDRGFIVPCIEIYTVACSVIIAFTDTFFMLVSSTKD